ncbi:hypothetical protein ZIOFF_001572 [Zingiber officinale]|uniref:dUTP diphosphatase n=1 Tax=Zingiber officinale TaxID=94328 RepID=A0A8J5I5Y5_ZINOF|nr:hypothetical protein ZIOFF_001572 [Zingiber officinale]
MKVFYKCTPRIPTQVNIPLQPQEVNSRNLIDGRISLTFTNYTVARTNHEPNFNDLDEEDMTRGELIVVLTEKHPATKLETKSSGTVGFDLSGDTACVIEPRGQALISTGLSLEIPWGTYGRIATRSSVTWKLGLDKKKLSSSIYRKI